MLHKKFIKQPIGMTTHLLVEMLAAYDTRFKLEVLQAHMSNFRSRTGSFSTFIKTFKQALCCAVKISHFAEKNSLSTQSALIILHYHYFFLLHTTSSLQNMIELIFDITLLSSRKYLSSDAATSLNCAQESSQAKIRSG